VEGGKGKGAEPAGTGGGAKKIGSFLLLNKRKRLQEGLTTIHALGKKEYREGVSHQREVVVSAKNQGLIEKILRVSFSKGEFGSISGLGGKDPT